MLSGELHRDLRERRGVSKRYKALQGGLRRIHRLLDELHVGFRGVTRHYNAFQEAPGEFWGLHRSSNELDESFKGVTMHFMAFHSVSGGSFTAS